MTKDKLKRTMICAGKLALCYTALAIVFAVYSSLVKFLFGKTGFVICTSVIVVLGVIYLGYIIARDEEKKGN